MSDRIAPGSTLIRNTLQKSLEGLAAGTLHLAAPVQLTASEFDDVRISVQSKQGDANVLVVSIAGPSGVLPAGAQEVTAGAYAQYATVLPQPAGGYELSLEVNLASIPTDEASRTAVVEHLASLRCVVYGTTLRNWFAAVANGTCAEGPLQAVPHRNKQAFYLKPQAEQIAVVFPMHFEDAKDAVIAQTFLAMFNEVRRQPALSTAPTCSYSKPRAPPLELQEGASAESLAANGGFVSFVLFKRHLEGPKLETAVWNMLSFYAFISFHIKCSKAHWHSRMRVRTDSLLQVLNRAKQEPFVKKEKKTASGRTFVRKDQLWGGGLGGMSGLTI